MRPPLPPCIRSRWYKIGGSGAEWETQEQKEHRLGNCSCIYRGPPPPPPPPPVSKLPVELWYDILELANEHGAVKDRQSLVPFLFNSHTHFAARRAAWSHLYLGSNKHLVSMSERIAVSGSSGDKGKVDLVLREDMAPSLRHMSISAPYALKVNSDICKVIKDVASLQTLDMTHSMDLIPREVFKTWSRAVGQSALVPRHLTELTTYDPRVRFRGWKQKDCRSHVPGLDRLTLVVPHDTFRYRPINTHHRRNVWRNLRCFGFRPLYLPNPDNTNTQNVQLRSLMPIAAWLNHLVWLSQGPSAVTIERLEYLPGSFFFDAEMDLLKKNSPLDKREAPDFLWCLYGFTSLNHLTIPPELLLDSLKLFSPAKFHRNITIEVALHGPDLDSDIVSNRLGIAELVTTITAVAQLLIFQDDNRRVVLSVDKGHQDRKSSYKSRIYHPVTEALRTWLYRGLKAKKDLEQIRSWVKEIESVQPPSERGHDRSLLKGLERMMTKDQGVQKTLDATTVFKKWLSTQWNKDLLDSSKKYYNLASLFGQEL